MPPESNVERERENSDIANRWSTGPRKGRRSFSRSRASRPVSVRPQVRSAMVPTMRKIRSKGQFELANVETESTICVMSGRSSPSSLKKLMNLGTT
jgi:hypothetical protein